MQKKSLSQDLDKQLAAKRQELSILETNLAATKSQWESQKKQIAEDTRITIESSKKAISDAVKDAKVHLIAVNKEIEDSERSFKLVRDSQHRTVMELEQQVNDLGLTRKVLERTNAELTEENRTLRGEVAVRQEGIRSLKSGEESLSGAIAELHIQEEQQQDKVVVLREAVAAAKAELATLHDTFKADKASLESETSILTSKRDALIQEIIANRAEDDKVRENLAAWEKRCDDRDKNIRIREDKLTVREKALVRNYNLMQM